MKDAQTPKEALAVRQAEIDAYAKWVNRRPQCERCGYFIYRADSQAMNRCLCPPPKTPLP